MMSPKMTDSPIKRESTSIKIRPDIWKEAKIEAIRHDMELSELVEQAIESWIEAEAKKLVEANKK
jgi:hypothetical protein